MSLVPVTDDTVLGSRKEYSKVLKALMRRQKPQSVARRDSRCGKSDRVSTNPSVGA